MLEPVLAVHLRPRVPRHHGRVQQQRVLPGRPRPQTADGGLSRENVPAAALNGGMAALGSGRIESEAR